jgi:acetyl-CoA C-acetyltransferase
MKTLRKKLFVAAGYTTVFFGSGRKEFNPQKPMPTFDTYLKETAKGTCDQVAHHHFDEGVIGSFMPARFINQANLPGFLPFMVPSLAEKPCLGVEGACGTGGRAITTAAKSILSDLSETTFVAGFEIQNSVKAVYGADILAGAAYYQKERKNGNAHFFPGIFAERAGAYYEKYGYDTTRRGMATWYQNAILNARKNPKAQEYDNTSPDLFALGMTPPDAERFIPYLNSFDCSRITDGAASLLVLSEEGLQRAGIDRSNAIEIIGIGEAERDITQKPHNLNVFATTLAAVKKALTQANITLEEISVLEIHDCFTISAILALEAIGLAPQGKGAQFILDGHTAKEGSIPTNLSGGLGGFGHPTGATGVRQMVDLLLQFTGKAANQVKPRTPYGMMVSMGGNDVTVSCIITKA